MVVGEPVSPLLGIDRRHWEACARDLRLPVGSLIGRIEAMIARITDALPTVAHALDREGVKHPVIGSLVDGISMHVRACHELLKSAG